MAGESLYVTQVIALYWVVSISMVYLNKILLSNEDASIPAPLFVTWYQVGGELPLPPPYSTDTSVVYNNCSNLLLLWVDW
jgi:hypothetical protein